MGGVKIVSPVMGRELTCWSRMLTFCLEAVNSRSPAWLVTVAIVSPGEETSVVLPSPPPPPLLPPPPPPLLPPPLGGGHCTNVKCFTGERFAAPALNTDAPFVRDRAGIPCQDGHCCTVYGHSL